MGRGYAVDCCVAEINAQRKRQNFETYITDAATTIINMLAGGNKFPRYHDLIHPETKDTRSGSEIADEIIKRHGLKVV